MTLGLNLGPAAYKSVMLESNCCPGHGAFSSLPHHSYLKEGTELGIVSSWLIYFLVPGPLS